MVGAADRDDEAERGAVLRGDRLAAVRTGEQMAVVGVLRAIDHPPAAVTRQFVPGWTEFRVQQ